MSVTRTTISVSAENWEYLKTIKNRSREVNHALNYYLKAKKFLAQKEEEFLLLELEDYYKEPEKGKTFEEIFGEPI